MEIIKTKNLKIDKKAMILTLYDVYKKKFNSILKIIAHCYLYEIS